MPRNKWQRRKNRCLLHFGVQNIVKTQKIKKM